MTSKYYTPAVTYLSFTGVILGIVFLLLSCDNQSDNVANQSDNVGAEIWAMDNIPRGARVIESVPAVKDTARSSPQMYTIFEFREQCFMMFTGYRRGTMVNINCPRTSQTNDDNGRTQQ